jgi:DNA-binding transcriptional regulator YhcF (GntR family)
MADTFTKDKFEWLDQVAADVRLPGTAFKLAYLISQNINRQSGNAWPSIATLANRLGTNEKTVRRLTDELCEAGHLEKKRGGDGKPNVYRLVVSDRTKMSTQNEIRPDIYVHTETVSEIQTGHLCPSDRTFMTLQSGHICPPNPLKEPFEEQSDGESLSPHVAKSRSQAIDADPIAGHFADWFNQYPRKVQRAEAERAYRRTLKAKLATPDQLINAVMRYAAERLREPDDAARTRFTAHPATWLNQHRWLDEPEAHSGKASHSQHNSKRTVSNLEIALGLVRESST